MGVASVYFFIGQVKKSFSKYEEAILYWEKSFEIDNEIPNNLFSKAFLYQEVGNDDKAIEMWEEIIKWLETRGFDVDTQFLKRELSKLKSRIEANS